MKTEEPVMMIAYNLNLTPGQTIRLPKKDNACWVDTVAEQNGFSRINSDAIRNLDAVLTIPGVRHNRLFTKDNILYHLDQWSGEYPFDGVIVREIGKIIEESNDEQRTDF